VKEDIGNLLKAEFVRDYNSLFDDFELFEERLQADAMRKNSPAG
jgi:hypothetical protein